MEGDEDPESTRGWTIACIVAGVLIAAWTLLGLGLLCSGKGEGMSHFGDHFNVINSIFSSVAVIIAFQTIRLQQKEFRDARKQAAESEQAQKSLAEIHALTAYSQSLATMVEHFREFLSDSAHDLELAHQSQEEYMRDETLTPKFKAEILAANQTNIDQCMDNIEMFGARLTELTGKLATVTYFLEANPYVSSKMPRPPASESCEPSSP